MSNNIRAVHEQGQSIWCDNLSRSMIDGGNLKRLIELGVVGITSNPTIFMKGITGGSDYDTLLERLSAEGKRDVDLYEGLILPDIADAADMLRPVYERTEGVDGFVSLEVNPRLAYDTEATIDEAQRLFARLDRPNVFVKVPATEEGIPAIERLIGEGVNVNVTLIFSIAMYEKVMLAYIAGLRKCAAQGRDISRVASVASFFVSRVDTLVDQLLEEKAGQAETVRALFGRAAVANAVLAYGRFQETFEDGAEFRSLAAQGARFQRPLWASTSTKNPSYPATKYVDELIGPHTVNTLPPQTIEAFLCEGRTQPALPGNVDEARGVIEALEQIGIAMKDVTDRLTVDGVHQFVESFDKLVDDIEQKRAALQTAS